MSRTRHDSERKAKKSFTLSREIVAFLESVRSQRNAESVSAILEEILQEVRIQRERAGLEQAVTDYYSSLSDSEQAEQSCWGEFALAQVSPKERA
ncbi:MAG: hypothetical protein JNK87_01960 [Bryobacterales bacterium]|nr:hypothetical protein [Bryobacterales bacterium]